MVINQTKGMYHEMMDAEGWTGKPEVAVTSLSELTLRVRDALLDLINSRYKNSRLPSLSWLVVRLT